MRYDSAATIQSMLTKSLYYFIIQSYCRTILPTIKKNYSKAYFNFIFALLIKTTSEFFVLFSADNAITAASARDRNVGGFFGAGGSNVRTYLSGGGGINQIISTSTANVSSGTSDAFRHDLHQQTPGPESFLERFQFQLKFYFVLNVKLCSTPNAESCTGRKRRPGPLAYQTRDSELGLRTDTFFNF